MAPAPGGPGPFRNYDYTIGSWTPSEEVLTWWQDNHGNESTVIGWPGIADVAAAGWSDRIWRWWPVWEDKGLQQNSIL
ncbi:hypothetical protein LTR43_012598, partial [Exophiala xenobiotica]